jgi:CheY-like chemotaxis protein
VSVRVLVVEDEALVRFNTVLHLEDEGFLVSEAGNADQAIAILERDPSIRLVFTDIDMPGSMDGLKLAAYVRGKWPPIHIIVTSGKRIEPLDGMPADSKFIPKPYELRALAETITEMVTR